MLPGRFRRSPPVRDTRIKSHARMMETTSAAAHVCPDCAARMEDLNGRIEDLNGKTWQLEDENRNLRLMVETLRPKGAWFAALLANSTEGVILTGPGRRILRVMRGLMGFVPGELQGALIESIVLPEDRHILVQGYRDLLDGRCGTAEFEGRALRPDGSVKYLAGTLTDMLDIPDIQAIVANYADVTRRKRME